MRVRGSALLFAVVLGLIAAGGARAAAAPVPGATTPGSTTGGSTTPGSTAAPATTTTTTVGSDAVYYVALGDSLVTGFAAPPGQGYVDDLYRHYRTQIPGLALANFGCSSETTVTFIHGGICSYPSGSQFNEALKFLRAHQGKIALLTIDIGGNDVVFCFQDPNLGKCFADALARMDTNIHTIMSELRAAAGPGVRFAAMTYFDPLLYLWFNGPANRELARATVGGAVTLNSHLTNDYTAADAAIADVAGAYAIDDFTIVHSQWGDIPRNVNRACAWLDITCGEGHGGFGDDANATGYRVIANSFIAVLSATPPTSTTTTSTAPTTVAPAPAPAPAPELPATGAGSPGLIAGAGILLLGAGALLGSRRQRTRTGTVRGPRT